MQKQSVIDQEERVNTSDVCYQNDHSEYDADISQSESNDFKFEINPNDTIFVLTYNPSTFKEGVKNIVSKIVVFKQYKIVNLDKISEILGIMNIETTKIFSIDSKSTLNTINVIVSQKGSKVMYIEMNTKRFIEYLNYDNNDFSAYNSNSMYILRNSNFLDIKNLFATVNQSEYNVCRGGSQKQHGLSPLDLRLSSYLLAMFNFNYKYLNDMNAFNIMSKNRYLS